MRAHASCLYPYTRPTLQRRKRFVQLSIRLLQSHRCSGSIIPGKWSADKSRCRVPVTDYVTGRNTRIVHGGTLHVRALDATSKSPMHPFADAFVLFLRLLCRRRSRRLYSSPPFSHASQGPSTFGKGWSSSPPMLSSTPRSILSSASSCTGCAQTAAQWCAPFLKKGQDDTHRDQTGTNTHEDTAQTKRTDHYHYSTT